MKKTIRKVIFWSIRKMNDEIPSRAEIACGYNYIGTDRKRNIAKDYMVGKHISWIADNNNCTRERVRQILIQIGRNYRRKVDRRPKN